MPKQIDPRGPRFGAAITSAVLAAALLSGQGPVFTALVAWQVVAFGLGAIVGLQAQPYGRIYARFVAPRLAAPSELEDPRPPRFAQGVGLAFAVVALAGALIGSAALAQVAVAFALAAALLNAVFGVCLGCEMYLLGKRLARPNRISA